MLTRDLATAVMAVDAARPIARNKRSGEAFGAGLGPHSETETFALVLAEAQRANPSRYRGIQTSVAYPGRTRQFCDAKLDTPDGALFLEAKLLRLKGDNGKPNDNMLTHILSPYPQHRSALTDCAKLKGSGFDGGKAVAIIGYDYPDTPLEPAISAFEQLAAGLLSGVRADAGFSGLCHPIHREGKVYAWWIS